MEDAIAQAVFKEFDKDGSEKISVEELSVAVERLGLATKKSDLKQMVKDDDVNGDGELDLKEFMIIVKRLQSQPDQNKGLASIINRKANSGPPLAWRECEGFAVSGDVLSRTGSGEHAVAVLDSWLSTASGKYDKASVTLELCGVILDGGNDKEGAFVGVVGKNFSNWNSSLGYSSHAVGVNMRTGHVHHKGGEGNPAMSLGAFAKPGSGTVGKVRLHLELNMREQSMRIGMVKGEEVEMEVTLEALPTEVALAVSLRAGSGQTVTVIGSSTERTKSAAPRRNSKELWDDDNAATLTNSTGAGGLQTAIANAAATM